MDVERIVDSVVARFIGTKHERDIKVIQPVVSEINALEPAMQKLPAVEPAIGPAFAAVREAGRRSLGMRHFDVQLIGGIVLHQGKIAEMKTGEGKTLVATLPAYLNALAGRGVHIVTVNDYLRDNMKYDLKDCVQRGHHYAIVDEVDSILIDEARTPLIISGPAEESTDKYYKIDKMIPKLIQDIDYTLDEKHKTATLTEEGVSKAEKLLSLGNLYDPAHMDIIHHVYQGLRAHTLFQRDVDYVVKDGEVVIVDEFTGRQMPGR